jgi:hypothetical protein
MTFVGIAVVFGRKYADRSMNATTSSVAISDDPISHTGGPDDGSRYGGRSRRCGWLTVAGDAVALSPDPQSTWDISRIWRRDTVGP